MTGAVPWEFFYILVGTVVGAAGGALAIWWRIERRIERAETDSEKRDELLHARISENAKDLTNYKLSATQQFASHDHLKEVEVRLTGAIDRLTNRIEQLPTKFAEEVARIVGAKPSRR